MVKRERVDAEPYSPGVSPSPEPNLNDEHSPPSPSASPSKRAKAKSAAKAKAKPKSPANAKVKTEPAATTGGRTGGKTMWDAGKSAALVEAVFDAAAKSMNMEAVANELGVNRSQVVDQLKQGRYNIRKMAIELVRAKKGGA